MAPRKRAGSKRGASVESEQDSTVPAAITDKLPHVPELPSAPSSKIPAPVRFPLLIVLSYGLSTLLNAGASSFTSGDLATVSSHRDSWWEIAGLLGWRAAELGISWWEEFDTTDQLSLTFLTHLPYLFFLTSFYKIRPTTAITCLTVDLVSTCAPFSLLRPSIASHKLKSPKGSVANRSVINDLGVQASISLFATGIYGVVVFASFSSFLPAHLVTHFDGIKDISSLRNSTFVWLLAAFLPTGFAAKTLLFTPATAAKRDAYDEKTASFDAENATLGETIEHNLWGFSKRTRVLIQRTATLTTMVGLHTWLHTYVAVDGAEGFGAAGWSGVWALAATLTGTAFWWTGNINEVTN